MSPIVALLQNTLSHESLVSGTNPDGKKVFLKEIWPTRSEIQQVEKDHVLPAMFKDVYSRIEHGSASWQNIVTSPTQLYQWDANSTYVKRPPFFEGMTRVRKCYIFG